MDFESIVGLLIIAVAWLVRLFARGAKRKPRPAEDPRAPAPAPARQEAPPREPQQRAIDLLRELGLDLREEPASPLPAAIPPVPRPPENVPPVLPPVPASPRASKLSIKMRQREVSRPVVRRLSPLDLRSQLLKDLGGGAPSLARAIVLGEILGPPRGLQALAEPFQR